MHVLIPRNPQSKALTPKPKFRKAWFPVPDAEREIPHAILQRLNFSTQRMKGIGKSYCTQKMPSGVNCGFAPLHACHACHRVAGLNDSNHAGYAMEAMQEYVAVDGACLATDLGDCPLKGYARQAGAWARNAASAIKGRVQHRARAVARAAFA